MTTSRWERLELLLEQAGQLPEEERAAFVDRETEGDPALRRELRTLLHASGAAADYVSRLRDELLGSKVEGMLRQAPADPDPWIGRTVSHYEILDALGGGGMGVVYRARDVNLDRLVALKFIAPEMRRDATTRRRFVDEARAASALDHPNICTIHEIAETDQGRLFIVMALYDGETLRTSLARGPVALERALDLSAQIAAALAAAHERGIVHRDVKPENVFVTREGVVKLLDFGLARTDDSRMSGPGAAEGTVAYMSPEQVRGERADARSDVWALGVMLFEMLAGARPFAASDPATALHLIVTQEPQLGAVRPDLPAAVVDLVTRALSKAPVGRFANGRAFLEALRGCQSTAGSETTARRARGRRRMRVVAGLSVGLLIVAVVALGTRGGPDTAPSGGGSATVSHILWVDDSPDGNAAVVQQLRNHGVHVTMALNTAEALQRYDPSVHELVISDMGRYEGADQEYVGRAGLHLLEQLRARRPDVRLVFCTSERAATTFRGEALSAGALDIVTDCRDVVRLIGF